MIGKNGSGKTSILDTLQLLGNFARGGVGRAFGPPPWSLGWQRSKGFGNIHAMRFEVEVHTDPGQRYRYSLSLDEWAGDARVTEERLLRLKDHHTIASFSKPNPPNAGTILSPDADPNASEVDQVARIFKSVVSYELNPAEIEQGTDPPIGLATKALGHVPLLLQQMNTVPSWPVSLTEFWKALAGVLTR